MTIKRIFGFLLVVAMLLPTVLAGCSVPQVTPTEPPVTDPAPTEPEKEVYHGMTPSQLDAIPCVNYNDFRKAMDSGWNFGWDTAVSTEAVANKVDFLGAADDQKLWHVGTDGENSKVGNSGWGVELSVTGKDNVAFMYNKVRIPASTTEFRVWAVGNTDYRNSGEGAMRTVIAYKDENGEYDFEALGAMDLEFLGQQLNDLLDGKKVEIPRFDFKEGKRYFNGNMMQLHDKDILIMEGIHALNPAMIPGVDSTKVFRVYASALTSLSIDENNNISTSDNRMLRRMIRDNRTRGVIPEETIMRWQSVRRGENRNIFPFQEHADAVFNSAHIFELPVLKYYAEPLLRRISPTSPAYTEASRMLKFLDYIVALSPAEIAAIPPTSILREFIAGQTL